MSMSSIPVDKHTKKRLWYKLHPKYQECSFCLMQAYCFGHGNNTLVERHLSTCTMSRRQAVAKVDFDFGR